MRLQYVMTMCGCFAVASCGGYAQPQTQVPTEGQAAPIAPSAPSPQPPGATPPATSPTPACVSYTWSTGASTMFANRCLGCHSSPSARFNAADKASVVSKITLIMATITGGSMPPSGKMDATTIGQVQAWANCNTP